MAYDVEAMRARLQAARARARDALDGQFSDIYSELRSLDPEEIKNITPDVTDEETYEELIELIQEATQQNLDNAELVDRIKEMGSVAIAIAGKVTSLSGLPDFSRIVR
ncbi:hypothetical protein [Thalassospira tepidiphila]|uniref:hypothetical protein n=1 Tax=Thalassospira tepidiphila TaxID=393657 RepID=UPI00291FA943|nr:hypothetical protein MACH01_37640 [Thalassospira tepidiphila]